MRLLTKCDCATSVARGWHDRQAGTPPVDTRPYKVGTTNATVGNFWPYATTMWDYTHRAMPFERPGSVTFDEVYSLTAYLLHTNGLVGERDVIDAHSLPKVRMPNRDNKVKIVVGGAPTSRAWADEIGADGWDKHTMLAVRLAKRLVQAPRESWGFVPSGA